MIGKGATPSFFAIANYNYTLTILTLNKLLTDCLTENIPDDTFTIGEYSFTWMSLEDMEKDERIMEVNEEVIAFVRSKCQ